MGVQATVVLETGVQNVPIALAVINISFGGLSSLEVVQAQHFPTMWGLFVSHEAAIATATFGRMIVNHEKR